MKELADDLLFGVEAIASFLGLEPRQTFHLAATKQIPAFKLGSKWVAKRSTLTAYFEQLDGGYS